MPTDSIQSGLSRGKTKAIRYKQGFLLVTFKRTKSVKLELLALMATYELKPIRAFKDGRSEMKP